MWTDIVGNLVGLGNPLTDVGPKSGHMFAEIIDLVVAVWSTLFQEGWKRENAVLAHVWDVEDFAEEEDPRMARPSPLEPSSRSRCELGVSGED